MAREGPRIGQLGASPAAVTCILASKSNESVSEVSSGGGTAVAGSTASRQLPQFVDQSLMILIESTKRDRSENLPFTVRSA